MLPEDLFKRAQEKAASVPALRTSIGAEVERFRVECAALFDQVPEPPVYRRIDDPSRKIAERLLSRAEDLWARCLSLKSQGAGRELDLLAEALWENVACLCHTADGRVGPAETSYLKALELERVAVTPGRIWTRSDEKSAPVFEKGTGASRYDPRPEPSLKVKLACPNHTCQLQADYSLSPAYATHRFTCPNCRRPFIGYFGEARGVEIEQKGKARHYAFRVEELDGGLSRVEFEEHTGAELTVARRDLLGFLYTEDRQLRGVLNLSSGRILWVQNAGGCFLATAAFGEDAPELAAFRAFRDEVLMRRKLGVAFTRGYYRFGPRAAKLLTATPPSRWLLSKGLQAVHRQLRQRGFQ